MKIAITIIIIVLFGWFLWWLSGVIDFLPESPEQLCIQRGGTPLYEEYCAKGCFYDFHSCEESNEEN